MIKDACKVVEYVLFYAIQPTSLPYVLLSLHVVSSDTGVSRRSLNGCDNRLAIGLAYLDKGL